jgi:hypothetical protein
VFRHKSRVQRAGVAIALLVSLCAGTFTRSHADDADFACNPVPVAHDERAHYIGADPTPAPSHADHCFLCHSLRSFHSAFDKFEHHDNAPRVERLHAAQVDRAGVVEWTLVPGRAPPV